MSERLRVGVIGCGVIAQIMHIPHLIDHDEMFQVAALADTHEPTLMAVADHHDVNGRYTDWRRLVEREDLDAVVICHSGSHRDSVIAALEAGKHVFVEKPLTWNAREAEEVAAVAARSGRVVQVGYHKLYDPGFAYAKAQVEKMSDLGFVRITVLHPADELGHSPYRVRRGNGVVEEGHVEIGDWDSQVQSALTGLVGGAMAQLTDEVLGDRKADPALRVSFGIMTISLIHQIYTLHGFLGAPTRVLNANIWRDGLSIHALLEYPDDLRVTLDWHSLPYLKDYREEYAFFGNHDRVTLQLPSPYFRNFPSPVIVQGHEGELAWEKRIIVSYEEAFQNELLAFHQNVREGRKPVYGSVEDAVQHMRFIQDLARAVVR